MDAALKHCSAGVSVWHEPANNDVTNRYLSSCTELHAIMDVAAQRHIGWLVAIAFDNIDRAPCAANPKRDAGGAVFQGGIHVEILQ